MDYKCLVKNIYKDASFETVNNIKTNQLEILALTSDGNFSMICGNQMVSFHLSANFKPFDMSIFDPTYTVVWSEDKKDMMCLRSIHCANYEVARECLKKIKSAKRKKIVK